MLIMRPAKSRPLRLWVGKWVGGWMGGWVGVLEWKGECEIAGDVMLV